MENQSEYDIKPEHVPEKLQPLAAEICTYFRELPRLVHEGQEGKIALIRGNELLGLWESREDASEAGYDRFGIEKFMVQPIKASDFKGLADFFRIDTGCWI